jgi:hypothetical protein
VGRGRFDGQQLGFGEAAFFPRHARPDAVTVHGERHEHDQALEASHALAAKGDVGDVEQDILGHGETIRPLAGACRSGNRAFFCAAPTGPQIRQDRFSRTGAEDRGVPAVYSKPVLVRQ